MSTEMATSNNGTAMALPAGLATAFSKLDTNITVGDQVPHLSLKGKVWKVVVEGNEKPLMALVDGEPTPAPTVKVVILNQVQKRSRVFFPDTYIEGTNVQPSCWSVDGETPDSNVSEPQSKSCSNCDQAVKGSKITDNGDQTTACSQNKRICIVSSTKTDGTALLVKLPVTSLWEKEGSEEAQGWYAYDAYLKHLKANNVPHTAMVVTTMKFDSKVAYPKVLFKHSGFVSEEVANTVVPRVESEEVMNVLGLGEQKVVEQTVQSASSTVAEDVDDTDDTSTAEVRTVADDSAEVEAKAAAEAEAKAAKAAKAKAAKEAKAAKAAAKAEAKAAAAAAAEAAAATQASTIESTVVDDDAKLNAVLNEW